MITMPYVNFAELSKERDNNHVEDNLPSTLYKNGDKITIKLKDGRVLSGTFNGYWGEDSDDGIFIDDYAISESDIADIIRNDIDNQINEVLRLAGVQLDESVGGNYLYHGTKLDVLFQILKDNMLKGSQSDYDDRAIYGVSTSRDMNFAYNFAEMTNHLDGTNDDESYQAVIVLDKTKLKQNHKIIPYNDQNAHNVYDNGERYFGIIPELLEKEEVIVGSIKNIKDYIIDIYVSPECKEFNTPEKMFMYYFNQRHGNKKISANDLNYYLKENSDIIRTLMNAKVYSIGRSEYNLRNNI